MTVVKSKSLYPFLAIGLKEALIPERRASDKPVMPKTIRHIFMANESPGMMVDVPSPLFVSKTDPYSVIYIFHVRHAARFDTDIWLTVHADGR